MSDTRSFLERLRSDDDFRRAFAADPAAVLAREGIEPAALALPERIDPDRLAALLADERSGSEQSTDPQSLWDNFGLISWRGTAPGQDSTSTPPTEPLVVNSLAAIVIYGTSVTTAPVVVAGESRLSAQEGGQGSDWLSVEQLAGLRALARQGVDTLRFSVSGADGSRVEGLDASTVQALLSRLG